MGFANLIALSTLMFIPVIILLYMLRPKHKARKIPSLYLWQSVIDEIESASRIHRLRNSILMILQIIAVVLFALILAGLFIKDDTAQSDVILVVDGSMTMQSTDIDPSRHAYAKELAVDYVKQLNVGSYVTVLGLSDTPDIVVNRTEDRSLAINGIEGLVASNGHWDAEVVSETLAALRQGSATVVYFGDQSIENAKTYLTVKDRTNYAIYDLVTTLFPSNNTMAVLSEVYNYGEESAVIPVSLYLDDLFFGAKEVRVEAGSSQKLLFDGLPTSVEQLKMVIDKEDVLPMDNTAMTVVKEESQSKVLLVSEGNLFLEKVLKLESTIDLYQVSREVEMVYEGYDLYIFDGFTPEIIPVDGALLFFAPSEDDLFDILGHVKSPDITTSGHQVTNTIEKPEFLASTTQVYGLPQGAESIYETSYGSCAYSWQKGHQKGIVYGFDSHQTDLPLTIEFPILMSSTFKYLLTASMVERASIGSGESIEITLKPSTSEGYIRRPNGQKIPLDMTNAKQLFVGTDDLGIYEVTQKSGDEILTEPFVVNAKKPTQEEISSKQAKGEEAYYNSTRSLKLWIGLALILIILIEWLIYSVRRRSR